MKSLEEKVETLSKQLDEKKKADELTEFERMRREAKDEAAKGVAVNVDILHQKLILLESLAAKVEISKKSEISMILARFQANKPTPRFAAALVLKLLSSKEEEAILDKEQKLMKQFGMSMAPGPQRPQLHDPVWGAPAMPTFAQWPRPPVGPPPRFPQARYPATCFRCKKVGHMIRDCPY